MLESTLEVVNNEILLNAYFAKFRIKVFSSKYENMLNIELKAVHC
jgi:hypothetical protein